MRISVLLLIIITSLSLSSQTVDKWEKIYEFQDTLELTHSIYNDGNHVLLTKTKVKGDLHLFLSTDLKNWNDKLHIENPLIIKDKNYIFNYSSIYFLNKSIFILIELIDTQGFDNVGNIINKYKSLLYKSSDLGENWEIIELSQNFRKRPMTYFYMENEFSGIFTQLPDSNEYKDRILVTKDGWKNYNIIDTNRIKVINKSGVIISTTAYIENTNITIYTAYNEILHSSNIGETWEAISVPKEYHNNSTSVKFQKSKNGFYLSGVVDKLVSTNDYGKSWNIVSEGNIFGAFAPFNDSVFSFNVGRKIYETIDKGKNYLESYYYSYGDIHSFNSVGYITKDKRIGIAANELLIENNEKYLVPPVFISPDKHFDLQPDFTVKWSKNSMATSYDIMVKELFDIELGDFIPIIDWESTELFYQKNGLLTNEVKFNNQKPNALYRVRIRCKNDLLESQWDEKSFFTSSMTTVEIKESNNDEFDVFLEDGIKIMSNNLIESIELLSYDGKSLYKTSNLHQTSFRISDNFKSGMYFIVLKIQNKGNYFRKVFLY